MDVYIVNRRENILIEVELLNRKCQLKRGLTNFLNREIRAKLIKTLTYKHFCAIGSDKALDSNIY